MGLPVLAHGYGPGQGLKRADWAGPGPNINGSGPDPGLNSSLRAWTNFCGAGPGL